jgi:hypothetical protein
MSNELTEAERAAAEALTAHHNAHSITDRLGVGAFTSEARAVVAAIAPIIEAEALNRHADKIDAFPSVDISLRDAFWYRDGLRDAAMIARDMAPATLDNT